MLIRLRVVALAIFIVAFGSGLSACSGGGSGSNSSALSPGVATATVPLAATASGTISIDVPPQTMRSVAFISPGTTHAAVFIDAAPTAAGSTTTCTASVSSGSGCTLTWSAALSVPAAHTFAVEIDNGTTVLAENEASYAIHAGSNGALAVLTLNGVASVAASSAETCTTTACSGTLTVADAASDAIVNTTSPLAPGFDNGPLAFASSATAVGSVTAPSGGTVTQPSASGSLSYTVTCASSGSFFTKLTPHSTTGSGDITSAELTSLGLAYPAAVTYGKTYSCIGTTIGNALYAGTNANANGLRVYTSTGAAATQAQITGGSTLLNSPQGVAVDQSGRIYAANSGANSVTVYAPSPSGTINEAPIASIIGSNTGLNGSQGIAVDASGHVYVANNAGNTVTVYAPNPSGTLNEVPVATIGGGSTTMNNPVGVAVDSGGRVYVANASGNDILVFQAYPEGNVTTAPIATISGAATLINNPNGVAVDASGRIYVANYGSNTVTMYAAYPTAGNEAPVATIGGGSTGLNKPIGVALDATGRIYVANYGASTVAIFAASPSGSVTTAPLASVTGISAVWGITVH